MEQLSVKHQEHQERGKFYFAENEKVIAHIHYSIEDNVLTIEHTVVEPDFEGQGLGKKLVDAVVEYSRDQNFKILPVCSYAKKLMLRTDSYQDVLIKS